MENEIPIQRLTWSERVPAARCLAGAFEHDPMMAWWVPDPQARSRLLPRFCAYLVRYGMRYGQVDASGAAAAGIAIWLPPAETHVSFAKLLYRGVWSLPFGLGIGLTRRLCVLRGLLDGHWQKLASRPRWYLQMLGVDPSCQGQGHASRLLETMLERLDQTRVACSLETSNPRNPPFYQRFGFEVLDTIRLPDSSVDCWLMLRSGQTRPTA